jgi:hypothetical protein
LVQQYLGEVVKSLRANAKIVQWRFSRASSTNAERLISQNWVLDLNGTTNEAHTANESGTSFLAA